MVITRITVMAAILTMAATGGEGIGSVKGFGFGIIVNNKVHIKKPGTV